MNDIDFEKAIRLLPEQLGRELALERSALRAEHAAVTAYAFLRIPDDSPEFKALCEAHDNAIDDPTEPSLS